MTTDKLFGFPIVYRDNTTPQEPIITTDFSRWVSYTIFAGGRQFELDPNHSFVRMVLDENKNIIGIEKRVSADPELWERLKEL